MLPHAVAFLNVLIVLETCVFSYFSALHAFLQCIANASINGMWQNNQKNIKTAFVQKKHEAAVILCVQCSSAKKNWTTNYFCDANFLSVFQFNANDHKEYDYPLDKHNMPNIETLIKISNL